MDSSASLHDLIDFLDSTPTSYHAAHNVARRLEEAGFAAMDPQQPWDQVPQRGVVAVDGAVAAWVLPEEPSADMGLRIYGAHTDSPALKIKPKGGFSASGLSMADIEVYGGALLHTWFDRELAIAGRLIGRDGRTHLVSTPSLGRVPTLAIHLDREVNTTLSIDRQRDLQPVVGLGDAHDLEQVMCERAGIAAEDVVTSDLFFVSSQPASTMGLREELLASARMDNLLSTWCGLAAIEKATPTANVQVMVCFDHEEIGSGTATGAQGPFLDHLLARLGAHYQLSTDAYQAWMARAVCLSADVAHARHPNRADHHDPVVFPLLNGGPVLKWSAPMRYATDAVSSAEFVTACERAGVPHQVFVNHGNIPGGSTIGALLATRLGIRTVDAGIPILSMHSAREMCAVDEPERFRAMTSAFLAG